MNKNLRPFHLAFPVINIKETIKWYTTILDCKVGRKDKRWVELFPVNNKEILIRVPWSELKTYSKWTSGWLQLPKDEDCDGN